QRDITEHPVGDVVVTFLGENVLRLPGLRKPRAEPAARALSGRRLDHLGALADVGALVLDLLHVALGVAMADEFPVALDASLDDVRIGLHRNAVNVHYARNPEIVV